MSSITERYAEIKDKTELDDKTDELIVECFKYKIFKEKPSKRFIEAFKDDYGHDYPIYVSDLTKKMTGKLRARIRSLKKEAAFEERMRRQRARHGYADAGHLLIRLGNVFRVWQFDCHLVLFLKNRYEPEMDLL